MPTWAAPPPAASTSLYLALGAASLSATILLLTRSLAPSNTQPPPPYPSPLQTHIPHLSPSELSALPYPPDLLPGHRSVPTAYGTIHVFELGPAAGPKVLLLHGISTPSAALAGLALALARRGCRVMLFDLFGRGFSAAPRDLPHDLRLYTAQALLALASSPLPWTGDDAFHLVGYSLGGGLAVGLARWLPRMVRSVVVIAGGGLVRRAHVGWRSRLLYSGAWEVCGVLERVRRRLVWWRLRPREQQQQQQQQQDEKEEGITETRMAAEAVRVREKHKGSDASGGGSFDNAVLLASRPEHAVSSVMAWQLRHHEGFIPAFVSSIRHAPIYEQDEDWRALGRLLAERRERLASQDTAEDLPGLRGGKILLVFGASDPVIVKEELIHDATAALGEEGFETVVLDAGHEVVMTKAEEVAAAVASFWRRTEKGAQELGR
ncbi:20f1f520-ed51-47b0-9f67-d314cde2e063 [Thermothielavioides terrestris]|uniref:20f1f520-ed51-47b0-9f67-d314cde2e063 n=1 Tax=Thermothielavioides terrestris TaxID=2587410 RepID=A0A3S4AJZ3_9PEZI|nr:20f1f520-ed51-47b0-9f67-d314cde2e063 [Thermothielavioides terrestris]